MPSHSQVRHTYPSKSLSSDMAEPHRELPEFCCGIHAEEGQVWSWGYPAANRLGNFFGQGDTHVGFTAIM